MEQRSLTVTYTPLESGDAESRWLRIEQEKPEEDETISVAEAAAIIDSLYNIEPCDDGMGGGGEETDEDKEPEEGVVEEALAEMLRRAGVCHEEEYWTAVIRVYRSHKWPETYEIRSETATVETTEPVRESYRQDVEVSGAVIELDMPYDGGLTGIPAGVQWEVRGSTVNLDRPVNGRLRLRYDTRYERVTLRVPTDSGDTDPQSAIGVVGGGDAKRQRPELPSAAVAVFWAELAASCELEPPEQDEEVSDDDLRGICSKKDGGGASGNVKPKDCWQTVTHYDRCSCSKKRINEWVTVVPVSCDEPATRESFGGYLECPEEAGEVHNPEYYERHCCRPPSRPLPLCRESYAVYSGGHGIEHGVEHWQNVYGMDVVMIPVLPKDGCGEVITQWNVPSRNCCDDVEPQAPHPDNPTTLLPGETVLLRVQGGQNPRTWRASAGFVFVRGEETMTHLDDGQSAEFVRATENACPNASIQVDDGCTRIHMSLTVDDPDARPMEIAPQEATVSPGASLSVTAYNNLGQVQWDGGELRLIGGQGQRTATFEAPDDFCGQTAITATDACMQIAQTVVLSTNGRWVEVEDFDKCNPPWSGKPCSSISNVGYSTTEGRIDNYQGYKARVVQVAGRLNAYGRSPECPEYAGDCSGAVESSTYNTPCGYNGNELFYKSDCTPIPAKPYDNSVQIAPLCHRTKNCTYIGKLDGYYYDYWTHAASQFIAQLWRWECTGE